MPSDGIDQITWHFTCTSKIKICYGIYINDDINLHVTYKFVYTCIYIIYEFKLKGQKLCKCKVRIHLVSINITNNTIWWRDWRILIFLGLIYVLQNKNCFLTTRKNITFVSAYRLFILPPFNLIYLRIAPLVIDL